MLHTQTMVIDADAHVLESERTWDYLEPAARKYRPVPITVPADPAIDPFLTPVALIQSFYPVVDEIARRRGRDPDRPPHLSKVTETL